MSQIPLVAPNAAGQAGRAGADEFARLEMQREQLQTMVADQAKVRERLGLLVPGLMIGLAVLAFFGVRSGEMAAPTAILTLVIATPLLFVLRRQIRSFASQIFVEQPDADELLAECEASISRLRERRS
jgi:hypothetical protein